MIKELDTIKRKAPITLIFLETFVGPFEKMSNFAQKERISFSELIRKATKNYIEEQENMNLSEYLNAHCESVSPEEEKELLEMLKDYDPNDKGREITLDEILQSNLSKKSR